MILTVSGMWKHQPAMAVVVYSAFNRSHTGAPSTVAVPAHARTHSRATAVNHRRGNRKKQTGNHLSGPSLLVSQAVWVLVGAGLVLVGRGLKHTGVERRDFDLRGGAAAISALCCSALGRGGWRWMCGVGGSRKGERGRAGGTSGLKRTSSSSTWTGGEGPQPA